MKTIDVFAREPHHALHAKALYDALPDDIRGDFILSEREFLLSKHQYVAVFSYGDLKVAYHTTKKIVFCEHGAGMFYNVVHASYAGSLACRGNVVLRLSPNKTHADKEKETLDKTPVVIVGMPKMDAFAAHRNDFVNKYEKRPDMKPTIAVSFHWDCEVCPETKSTYKTFLPAIARLQGSYNIVGHGHPRILNTLRGIYREANIKIWADFNRVLREADMYVCDNSSTIYEFGFMRKPIVLLNGPTYRKNVEHPGNPRFWKHADIGPQVDSPMHLTEAFNDAWDNFPMYLPKIDAATNTVFTYTDGKCAQRAANAIAKIIK